MRLITQLAKRIVHGLGTALLAVAFGWPMVGGSADAATAEAEPVTITDAPQLYPLSTEQRARTYPLHLEGRISFVDLSRRRAWIENNNIGYFLYLAASAPPLRTGQSVVIEGKIIPKDGLSADLATVRVVEEAAPFTPLVAQGRINDFDSLHWHMVTVEGYVDSQQYDDDEHIRLTLIVENRPVICWITPDDPKHVPDWQGNFVRVTGLYSNKFDLTLTGSTIDLFSGRQDYLQVVGSLRQSTKFNRPVTAINTLYQQPTGTEVLVRGQMVKHAVGKAMTVRDATGQVEILSVQQQRLPVDSEVEAVGQVTLAGGQWVLDAAFYRPVQVADAGRVAPAADGVLRNVAQIRLMGEEEAAKARPVEITGMVSWALPESPFVYLQDLTGGIRVYYDRAVFGLLRFGKHLRIRGVTRAGRAAPTVELRELDDWGIMSYPPATPVTYEQAMTGKEEGEWVELRGFMQGTESEGKWRWIHVTTPTGDFTGLLQNPVGFVANPGSLIRMRGVCETTLDAAGHSQGIILRIPFIHDITIEEDAPADYYALPRHALGDLSQLSTNQEMMRVRVAGTVQYASPGSRLYLEDEQKGLLILTHGDLPLQPGDRIEAVGILGREGARAILREAVYRKTGAATTSEPLQIAEAKQIVPAADSRLVRLRGLLIDSVFFAHLGQTRLTLQQGSTFFEATLSQPPGSPRLEQAMGSGLEVTGIYQLKFDDAGQARGFQVLLRSPADVTVYMKPRLWTVQRVLFVTAVLGGFLLLGLVWISALRRQVRQKTTQLRSQMEHQARLEAEVQRAARLESLGVLAGGMAHDYNNLLTVILGNLSLMRSAQQVLMLEGIRLEEIEKAALRARDLTRQLLTFADGDEPLCGAVDLPALVCETTEFILRGGNMHCTYEVGPGVQPAYVDRDQIIQVVQNMVHNAVEAMPGGGTLRLLLANADIPVGFQANLKPGRYIRFIMIDSGEGIAPAVLPRIFDPYFSTKKTGGGLGLATVYSIVKKHHGHIEVQSQPGQGSTFTLWLPAAESSGTEAALETFARPVPEPTALGLESLTPPAASPHRVLLMDDEESIRKLGAILLQRMGLEVTSVTDGAGAVREFEAARHAGRPFALLVLDLTIIGGMGGKEAIQLIRESDPHIPVIVSSGYSRDPVMAQYRSFGFQAVIPKPYDIKRFKEVVLSLLPKS